MRFPSNPILVRTALLGLTGWLRATHASMDVAFELPDPGVNARWCRRPLLYAFYHEMLMFPACYHARFVTTLVSRHRDGEYITQVVRLLRGKVVRGSTGRGGVQAVRQLLRAGRLGHLAVTVDGPRGPRRVVQPGAVYLASRAGLPVVPLGFAYRRCRRAGSWDRMAVPYPFTVARGVSGLPREIPPDLGREGLEAARCRIQQELDAVQARAEALAAGARPRDRLISLDTTLRPR
jgi:hypothetical protein